MSCKAPGLLLRALRARAYDDIEVHGMFKRLLAGITLALCLGACATPSAPSGEKAAKAQAANPPPGCVAGTATRLPTRPGECAGFGNTWTQQDLKSTGATDVGQGLSVLDPALTTTGPGRP